MRYDCIVVEHRGPVAIIRLSRPEVLNAMNQQMWEELNSALDAICADESAKVLIFTGEGRSFSSGADLKESKTRSLDEYRNYIERLQLISKKIIEFKKPTIAAINGYAIGSGYELALACDIRIAAKEAQIGSPEAKVASVVTGGTSLLLQQLVGPGKARELLFTGEFIDGSEAERIGLVNYTVAGEELMECALEMANKISENSQTSLSLIKKGLTIAAQGGPLDELLAYEVEACLKAVSSKDREKALEDFESRKRTRIVSS